jgi:hypothetical protein
LEVQRLITLENIKDAINVLLVEAFPSAQAYINACPPQFQRPAYLIQCMKNERTDKNRSTVSVTAYFKITYFPLVDVNGIANASELLDAQNALVNLFCEGYIEISDRNIKLKSSTTGINSGDTYLDVQFEFFDDRIGITENTEIMNTVNIIIS